MTPSGRYQNTIVAFFALACLFSLVYVSTKTSAPGQVHEIVTKIFKVVGDNGTRVSSMRPGNIRDEPKLTFTQGQNELNLLRKEGVAFSLYKADIDKMTGREVDLSIHSYVDNSNTICWRKLRMGKIDDGGWEICDDPEVRPVPPCIIYSFGINNDFSFDDDSSRLYGCHVYSFDPSMKKESHNRSSLVHFYNWGIGGKTEVIASSKWQMFTYKDLRAKLGHADKKIDIVKMDVEMAEWPTIHNMIATDQFKDVKQFLVEYHFFNNYPDNRFRLKQFQSVEMEGFRKFMVHKNHLCRHNVNGFPIQRTFCYEVHYKRDYFN